MEYIDVYQIKDCKITTYGSWLTEQSLARFKPTFAAAVPPKTTATPPSAPPVSEFTVTIAGGACSTQNPLTLQAGEVKVNPDVQDQDKSSYALRLFNPDQGKD